MDVLRYRTPAGADPVGKYLDRLPADEGGEVESALVALEQYGFDGDVDTRQVRGKLWELKVGDHRLFYVTLSGPRVVLLHAYRKQSRKAPPREIDTALARMKEVLSGE